MDLGLGELWELVMDREACCGSWGCKESDRTQRLNWTERLSPPQKKKKKPYKDLFVHMWLWSQGLSSSLEKCLHPKIKGFWENYIDGIGDISVSFFKWAGCYFIICLLEFVPGFNAILEYQIYQICFFSKKGRGIDTTLYKSRVTNVQGQLVPEAWPPPLPATCNGIQQSGNLTRPLTPRHEFFTVRKTTRWCSSSPLLITHLFHIEYFV